MKRKWNKNPANHLPIDDEKPIIPVWFSSFMIIASIYLVYSCFWWGNAEGERELEKAKNRVFMEQNDDKAITKPQ